MARMSRLCAFALAFVVLGTTLGLAQLPAWEPVAAPYPRLGEMMQLRDGRILIHEDYSITGTTGTPFWHILSPNPYGNYSIGTWTDTDMPSDYGPKDFSSQVLVNGNVLVEGGEYNLGEIEPPPFVNLGALGTVTPWGPIKWTKNNPPEGWANIGDAQSVILPNGQYLQGGGGSCEPPKECYNLGAIYLGPNKWKKIAESLTGNQHESAYTLLPNGKILMVDATKSATCPGNNNTTELYDYRTNAWSCGPTTPFRLWADNSELGPAVLMRNGKVLQVGGVSATAIYNTSTNSWSNGPLPPRGLVAQDAPAALEPNGKVLMVLGKELEVRECHFAEYDPQQLAILELPDPQPPLDAVVPCSAVNNYSGYPYNSHLMVIPTGQILFTYAENNTPLLYNPTGSPEPGAAPVICPTLFLPCPKTLRAGSKNNLLYGLQLNGLSQNNAYGDENQSDTNFPLVRFVGDNYLVYYGFTHNESTHSVARGTLMYTLFDLNPAMPPGTYWMESVASGVASNRIRVTVVPAEAPK